MDDDFYENEFECRYPERSMRQTVSSKDGAKRKDKKVSPMNNLKEKRRQGQLTTKWLKQNYCACPDVCLPREIVYEQYLEFCRREKIFPACKATFGKLIRSTFPEVSSKRLGARGHSKYHYNGIGMKPSSEFRSVSSGTEGVTRFSVFDNDTEQKNLKKFSPSSKVGTLLPNFPDAENLIIPVSGDKTKEMMATFILMYKTHCQCIVDVVISGNFEEIRLFLLHFWQGFPEHLMCLKDLEVFLYVVAFCDCILYRTLLDVLIPSVSFEMPEKLLRSIHNIGTHWSLWVQCSLENMPDKLLEVKMASAKRFCRSLKRCVAFMHLLQVNRSILSSDAPLLLAKELEELAQEIENRKCFFSIEEEMGSNENLLLTVEHTKEFQNILKQCGSVSVLIEYLDKMILNIKGWNEDQTSARNFVFNWVYTLSKLSYLLTENRSRYFITFHLLSSFIQEYLLLAVETHLEKEQEKYIHDRLNKHLKNVGSFALESFKPTTSCFLVNKKSHSLRNYVSKQRQKKTQASVGLAESQLPRISYLTGTKTYPKTCTYYLRTETGESSQELPSCKYASSSCHGNTVCDISLSCVATRDQSCVRVLNPHQSGHFTNSLCGNVNSPDGFTTPQFEFYQLERNPCSSFPHRTFTNHESYPWNQR